MYNGPELSENGALSPRNLRQTWSHRDLRTLPLEARVHFVRLQRRLKSGRVAPEAEWAWDGRVLAVYRHEVAGRMYRMAVEEEPDGGAIVWAIGPARLCERRLRQRLRVHDDGVRRQRPFKLVRHHGRRPAGTPARPSHKGLQ